MDEVPKDLVGQPVSVLESTPRSVVPFGHDGAMPKHVVQGQAREDTIVVPHIHRPGVEHDLRESGYLSNIDSMSPHLSIGGIGSLASGSLRVDSRIQPGNGVPKASLIGAVIGEESVVVLSESRNVGVEGHVD